MDIRKRTKAIRERIKKDEFDVDEDGRTVKSH